MQMRHVFKIAFMLLLLLFNSCEKEEDFNVQNLNHNVIMILGHGGMGDLYKYPNNSLEAIHPVIGIGADGTEVDVQLSKDSVLVLYHDEDLERGSNCAGYISDYTFSEISYCRYANVIAEIPIYSVEQMFNSLPALNDLYFSFDCKLNPVLYYDQEYRKRFLRAIKRLGEKYGMSGHIFIEGDLNFQLLAIELGMNTKGILIGGSVEDAVEHGIFGIGATTNTPAEEINYAHSKGIYVMMWGMKTDFANKKAIRLNPDFVQTDKPIPMLMLFNRFNYDYRIP